MSTLLIAIHGILTSQTDASWPDRLDAWMYRRDSRIKVLKKEYSAGPFPRWNCWVKDPRLARSLANELELFLETERGCPSRSALTGDAAPDSEQPFPLESNAAPSFNSHVCGAASPLQAGTSRPPARPELWFVAHSNGAVIALLTARRLIARGHKIGGLILTGAACEANLAKNGILEWLCSGVLGAAIAYCSPEDEVLDGALAYRPPTSQGRASQGRGRLVPGTFELLRHPGKALFVTASQRIGISFQSSLPPKRTATGDETSPPPETSFLHRLRVWLWGKLMWPYGCLGRTGWLLRGQPLLSHRSVCPLLHLSTRWFPGGHCTYFNPRNIEATFEQIYQDIRRNPKAGTKVEG